MLFDVLSDVLFEPPFDVLFDVVFDMLSDMLYDVLFDMLSDILSDVLADMPSLDILFDGQFNVSGDNFRVENGDYFGWTNEDESSLISFDFIPVYKTYYTSGQGFPVVGQNYNFDVQYPAQFSFAIKIDTRMSVILLSKTRLG
jgi:hypothetical protein